MRKGTLRWQRSKVKARIWTHLLYRHWDHFTGDKKSHLFQVLVDGGGMRDLNPGDTHGVPPDYASIEQGCGCDISPDSKELVFTENFDPVPAVSTHADIFTLDLIDPAAKPVKVSTSAGGNFNPAYSPDGKYLAWRSQARNGYESDQFRLVLYAREKKAIGDLLKDAKLPNTAPAHFDLWVDEFAWSSDSRSIYFASGDKGEEPIVDPVDGTITFTTVSFSPFVLGVAVPEPSSLVLAVLAGLAWLTYRKRIAAA